MCTCVCVCVYACVCVCVCARMRANDMCVSVSKGMRHLQAFVSHSTAGHALRQCAAKSDFQALKSAWESSLPPPPPPPPILPPSPSPAAPSGYGHWMLTLSGDASTVVRAHARVADGALVGSCRPPMQLQATLWMLANVFWMLSHLHNNLWHCSDMNALLGHSCIPAVYLE